VKPSNSLAGLASIIIPRCDPLELTRRCGASPLSGDTRGNLGAYPRRRRFDR
jgi:hypothetical protein